MRKKLTKQEDEALWLLRRKGRVLDLQYALKLTKDQALELIEVLAAKTGCALLNKRDINNGGFWKRHGEHVPFGEK